MIDGLSSLAARLDSFPPELSPAGRLVLFESSRIKSTMEESPFDFQPNPFETYEADLFSCNGNAFAFDNAEEQPSNFRYMLESHEQELIPGLSPDTSLKVASLP